MQFTVSRTLVVISLLTIWSCNRLPYETSEADDETLSRNDDNQVFVTGSTHSYSFQYFNASGVEEGILITGLNLKNGEPLPIVPLTDSARFRGCLGRIDVVVEEATAMNEVNQGQSTFMFNFYDKQGNVIPFSSKTGLVDNASNIWMHTPRLGPLKALNLFPYPYIKIPITVGEKWSYKMPFDSTWFHQEFVSNQTIAASIVHHQYEVVRKTSWSYQGQSVDAYLVHAEGHSEVGKFRAEFVANAHEGFLKMSFIAEDGREFRLTKLSRE